MRAGILVSLCLCISSFLSAPLPISAQGASSGSAASAAGRITAATSSLNQLSDLDAGFLIPDTYNKVREAYDRYTRDIREGKSTQDIQRTYSEFDAAVTEARERLDRVNELLMVPLEKRAAAQRANAPAMVPEAFEEAESRLERAISRLEDDRVSDAFSQGQEAAALYDVARSSVIEMSLIGSAQIGLAEAEDQDWDRLAPASFAQARRLVDEVTGALDRGEPLSAALRSKAQTADYAVRRAIEIAAQVDGLRSDPGNWERMLLSQEDLARQAADMAGVGADFLANDPQTIMTESLRTLAARQDSLGRLLQLAEVDAAALRAEVDSLHQAIEEQQIRLSSMVESYQQDLQRRKEELDRERRELRDYLYEKTQLDAAAQAQERFSDERGDRGARRRTPYPCGSSGCLSRREERRFPGARGGCSRDSGSFSCCILRPASPWRAIRTPPARRTRTSPSRSPAPMRSCSFWRTNPVSRPNV